MAQVGYSKKAMEHFMNPRNVGVIENPDCYGKVGNPVCGDLVEIFITVKDDKIDDIKFRTFGCSAAIAVSSMVTEMAKGKPLEEAIKITRMDVADELEGLPPQKMHCSNLGADALHAAIKNYWARTGMMKPEEVKVEEGDEGRVSVERADF
jgi:nitrogen fixation NifU-like protein